MCDELELIYGLGVFSGGILKYTRSQRKGSEDKAHITFVILAT